MKELIEKIEHKDIELNVAKFKVRPPQLYPHAKRVIEIDLLELAIELFDLKNEARQQTQIQTQKYLLFEQLSEYIEVIEKLHQHPYSKKQGLHFDLFCISPLTSIKDIIFFTQNSLEGVTYNLALNQKDPVISKKLFLDFLKTKKLEILDVNDLSELYEFYKSFSETIRNDFS